MVSLTKFRDQLLIPGRLKPVYKNKQATYYEVRMLEAYHSFHSELPATLIWGYEGMCPGPVIEVRRNEKVLIKWENQLPEKHFLPVDKTFHGLTDLPEVRTVVHVHGAKVRPESDGYPEAQCRPNPMSGSGKIRCGTIREKSPGSSSGLARLPAPMFGIVIYWSMKTMI